MTTMQSEAGARAAATIKESLGSRALLPGEPGYDEARAVWNGMIGARPAVIARCAGADDVRAVLGVAHATGLPLAVRGGGHNVGGFGTIDGGIVLDLSPLNAVSVDADARLAVVGGGATWRDVDAATQAHGLATPGGVVSDTGVGGLTLSGGFGWLRRKHGLTVDNLVEAEVVTADGEIRRAAEDGDADLLWAIRGGGGNFGVATSLTFRLHPLGPEVYFAFTLYPLAAAPDVLLAFDAFMRAAPDEFSHLAVLGRVPAVEAFAPELHHEPFVAVLGPYAGPADEGERASAPLRSLAEPLADLSGTMQWVEAQQVYDEDYPAGMRYYWKSLNLPELTPGIVATLVEHAEQAPSDHSTIDVWANGGAISRVPEEATAFGGRDSRYVIGVESNWEDESADDANVAWARDVLAALDGHGSGGLYLNFAGLPDEAAAAVPASHGRNFARLAELKARYDPGNLFRHNQNIPPAA